MKKQMKKLLVVCFALSLLIVACSSADTGVVQDVEPVVDEELGSDTEPTAAPTLTAAPTFTPLPPTDTPEPSPTPEPEMGTFSNPYPFSYDSIYTIGYEDWLTDKYIEYSITVKEIKWGDDCWLAVQSSNQFNDPSEEGTEYLCLFIVVTNIGDNPIEDLGPSDFATVSDGTLFDNPWVVEPKPAFDVEGLFPGGSGEGWITMTINAGDTDPLFSFSDDPIEVNSLVQLIRP